MNKETHIPEAVVNRAEPVKNKICFSFLYEVRFGNPNGDPDYSNHPRLDPSSETAYTTDVCQKRKIRNYVEKYYAGQPGMAIYVKEGVPLNVTDQKICQASLGIDPLGKDSFTTAFNNKVKAFPDDEVPADWNLSKRDYLSNQLLSQYVREFFDIRAFGQVLASYSGAHIAADHVKGPVVLHYPTSVHSVEIVRNAVSRCTVTRVNENKDTDFGSKFVVPYALFRCNGTIEPPLATVTGFSEDDLQKLFEAIEYMHETDVSAARPNQLFRGLYIWRFDTPRGGHINHAFDSLVIKPLASAPRSIKDFEITCKEPDPDSHMTLETRLNF